MERLTDKHYTDICVCCGAAVPEGRMICWACEHKYLFEDDMQMKGGNE